MRLWTPSRKHIELNASPQRVWRALTDHREFGEWFGVKIDQPFVEGRVTRGRISNPDYDHLTFEFKVVRLQPQSLFGSTGIPMRSIRTDYSQETPTLVEFRLQESHRGTPHAHRIGVR